MLQPPFTFTVISQLLALPLHIYRLFLRFSFHCLAFLKTNILFLTLHRAASHFLVSAFFFCSTMMQRDFQNAYFCIHEISEPPHLPSLSLLVSPSKLSFCFAHCLLHCFFLRSDRCTLPPQGGRSVRTCRGRWWWPQKPTPPKLRFKKKGNGADRTATHQTLYLFFLFCSIPDPESAQTTQPPLPPPFLFPLPRGERDSLAPKSASLLGSERATACWGKQCVAARRGGR